MRKFVLIGLVVAAAGGAAAYFGVFSRSDAATPGAGGAQAGGAQAGAPGGAGRGGAAGGQRPQGGGGGGFPGGPGGGGGMRVPMTVEVAAVKKGVDPDGRDALGGRKPGDRRVRSG